MPVKTKAVSYLRVSGKGQVEGDGLPRQREAIAKYAKAHGIEIIEEFADEGVSGRKELANREGLAACLDRVESNGVKMVLVERADRLARDAVVSELIVRQFQKADVKVVAADGGTDLTEGDDSNPTAKLVRTVLAAVAEFDRAVVTLKLRAARDRKRRTEGRCEGRKPYGYSDAEKQVVERILDMRRAVKGSARLPFEKIAAALNDTGIPTRTGSPWAPGTVFKIVRTHAPQLTQVLE